MNESAAGWYADYADPSQLRYWDGTRWTGNLAPAWAAQEGRTGQPPTPRRRPPFKATTTKTLAGLLALAAFSILCFSVFDAPEADNETVDRLEAGGRFALNVTFFLPLLLATVVCAPLALFGTLSLARAWLPSNIAIGLAGLGAAVLSAVTYANDTLRTVAPSISDVAGPAAFACALLSLALIGLSLRLARRPGGRFLSQP